MEQLFDKAVSVGVKSPERDDRYMQLYCVSVGINIFFNSMRRL